ncbi:hypothetical protein E7735_22220 [Enterobacter cloacae]|uniref:hypothetical protein n=1 Tax=Enterobacter cloacae TaxID=550 RepID=UPI000D37E2DE|nr:hypothetical protein [Enterobacter cloacae]QCC93507.1 hypothetical protein E7735_22220 [Enterobacter cloacae]QCC98509.1 hypothetical protein E7739_21915 [Enterobacter cloacae]QCD09555.1 hypothetical protein E7729_02645 [Enterobacter cloacae]
MATTPTQTHPLFTLPLTPNTDFTELADNCERFIDALVSCDEPGIKIALCGRLSVCLALLQPTLLDPVPEHLKENLTVESLPTRLPVFEPEADQLGHYCQALTQLLMSGALMADAERVMQDLLFELVTYYSDTLKMPRWLRTEEGMITLE